MAENKHQPWDLAQMQSLPLSAKIRMTQQRIRAWYEHWDGQVYVSFLGGKDSTVLKHLVDSMYSDVPAVFVNTGLEYPEIQNFVREVKSGKYDCFNSDVEMLRPEMRFDEVIKTYGYPVFGKEIAYTIRIAQNGSEAAKKKLNGLDKNGKENLFRQRYKKYSQYIDCHFPISEQCCDVMKKKPCKMYEKETNRKPIIGTMATESALRKTQWLKTGCNAFDSQRPKSNPISFWTEHDVLEYIVKYEVPYASVYGQIQEDGQLEGQMFIDGFHEKLCTTGVSRTGCMFCIFGITQDRLGENGDKNRFQLMKETHPRQYEYCMKPVEDGGLGIKEVLEYIGVPYE